MNILPQNFCGLVSACKFASAKSACLRGRNGELKSRTPLKLIPKKSEADLFFIFLNFFWVASTLSKSLSLQSLSKPKSCLSISVTGVTLVKLNFKRNLNSIWGSICLEESVCWIRSTSGWIQSLNGEPDLNELVWPTQQTLDRQFSFTNGLMLGNRLADQFPCHSIEHWVTQTARRKFLRESSLGSKRKTSLGQRMVYLADILNSIKWTLEDFSVINRERTFFRELSQ